MKTLVNKNNPQIRITAPEVEQVYDKYYYIIGIRLGLLQENWTLVEEEPTEGIKGNLEGIPSNVDLEKEIERFLNSEESTSRINAGRYDVAFKDTIKIARHFYELGFKARKK